MVRERLHDVLETASQHPTRVLLVPCAGAVRGLDPAGEVREIGQGGVSSERKLRELTSVHIYCIVNVFSAILNPLPSLRKSKITIAEAISYTYRVKKFYHVYSTSVCYY